MIIGIDISMLVYQGSGVATYTHNLVKSLLKNYPDHDIRLFYSSLRRPKDFASLDELHNLGAKIYSIRIPTRILRVIWNRLHVLPVELFIGKVDVFFSSDYLRPPLKKGTRGVTTIHDLTWSLYPQFHTKGVIKDHKRKIQKTIKYKDTIICDSLSTKKDLIKLYPKVKKNNKIHVIYSGVSDRFHKITNKTALKKALRKYKVKYPGNYLVYVGAIEPRKNINIAIETFASLIKDPRFSDYQFLIAGKAGWKNANIFQLVKDLELEQEVRFLGYVSDEDLPALYSASKICMYLSAYEGFGLPPLEAARCGTPTLLYKNSSLQELFHSSYPYAKKGSELRTLISILTSKKSIIPSTSKFSWDNFAKKFATILGL